MKKEERRKNIYKKESKSGITLIALIITIIVLLILAGVSISMIAGEEGILTQVKNAEEENKKAEVTEKLKLKIYEAQIDIIEKTEKKPTIKQLVNYLQNKYGEDESIEFKIKYTKFKETATVIIDDSSNGKEEPIEAKIQFEGWEFLIDEDLKIDETKTIKLGGENPGDDNPEGENPGDEPPNTYAITYDVNGGTGEITGQNIEGETVTLSNGSAITRESHRLYKWNTKADGTGTSYDLGEEIQASVVGEGITLYAKWLPIVEGAVIPDGFYYVGGTETTGVVISDDPDDENDYSGQEQVGTNLEGNQFVWVPVNSTIGNNDMYITSTTEGGQSLTSVTYTNSEGTSVKTNITTNRYSKLYDFTALGTKTAYSGSRYKPGALLGAYREPEILNNATYGEKANYGKIKSRQTGLAFTGVEQLANQYVTDYNDMIESIEIYGGFYVGRYELTGTVDNPTQVKGNVLTDKDWYDTYNICQSFTKGIVQSTMIWGCQWDAIMAWIDSTAETTGKYVDSTNSSTSWGNYKTETFLYDKNLDGVIEEDEVKDADTATAIPTGSSEYTKANNIYDLAGNYYEWTQEADGTSYRVLRGYDYHGTSTNYYYAANRGNHGIISTNSDGYDSSRPTLYIK